MIFYDTETCGLHSFCVLIQYTEENNKNEEIHLHEVWTRPIKDTLELIELFMRHEQGLVGFNLAFDHFHLCKLYTVFRLLDNLNKCPIDCIEEIYEKEPLGRDGPCLKPQKCLDLMLHARKSKYQICMDRKDIKIRKVPNQLVYNLINELDNRIGKNLPEILFAKKKENQEERWIVKDVKNCLDFKDIILKFKPSSALKSLAKDALSNNTQIIHFNEIELDKRFLPSELGYAPFGKAANKLTGKDWRNVIKFHVEHWQYDKAAREYARQDVILTRALYYHFLESNQFQLTSNESQENKISLDDDDSTLACMVAACRWKGFSIDCKKLLDLCSRLRKINNLGYIQVEDHIPTAPRQVLKYLTEVMTPMESYFLNGSTKKVILQEIAKWKIPNESGNDNVEIFHPVAIRAQKVMAARDAKYDIGIYEKLLLAGRLHASLKPIGTLSGRMAGGDDLNIQGIKHTKEVRSCFILHELRENSVQDNKLDESMSVLCGGDFESFEVALAEASYRDPNLKRDLLTCSACGYIFTIDDLKNDKIDGYKNTGKCPNEKCRKKNSRTKIHALFAMKLFPGKEYDEIIASKGTTYDMYDYGKRAVFALIYGGNAETLANRLGIDIELAKIAYQAFLDEYKEIAKARGKIFDDFCSMKQPNGIGTRVVWNNPKDYIESMLGFRRYFAVENQICKALFELANNPPKEWIDSFKGVYNHKLRCHENVTYVIRRDREQTVSGAVQSALYAAAFNIQALAMRAACNHVIQSTGAQINKNVQRKIWDLQPCGINAWKLMTMNIHDEIMVCCRPDMVDIIKNRVQETVESYRNIVPLIEMKWSTYLKDWSEK